MLTIRAKLKPLYLLHLSNFQQCLLCSTAENTQSFTNYLVNSLGFSPRHALNTSNKVNNFNIINSNSDPNSIINFLRKHDFNDTHIKKIVSLCPNILSSKLDETLIPNFRVLQDLGISGSDLVYLVSLNPVFLSPELSDIIVKIRSVFRSDKKMLQFLIRCHGYTNSVSLNNLVCNAVMLENEFGVSKDDFRSNAIARPWYFLRNTEVLRNVATRVVEELGIMPGSKVFVYGICLLCCSSGKNIDCKRKLFKSFGWSDDHVSELIRKLPVIFMLYEETIRKKLEFLVNELGYKPDFLITHFALFTCSVENRIIPRYRVLQLLKNKGLLDYNLYNVVLKSEPKFLKMFIEPFKEYVPGLPALYQNSKGCPDS